jgi:glutamine synthetase
VTVLFSDLEGSLHVLDYDKKFLIKSWDNLTLMASIGGYCSARAIFAWHDWAPSTGVQPMFGPGKVLVFGV